MPPGDKTDKPPIVIQDNIRAQKRTKLDSARKAYSIASERLRVVRETYAEELALFLTQRKKCEVIGTKEEFDHSYFLEHGMVAHDYGMAREKYDFAKREAMRVGATPQQNEPPDDPSEANSEMNKIIWEFRKEKLEEWLKTAQTQDSLSQNGGDLGHRTRDEGGKSVLSVSERLSEDFIAIEPRRTEIDDWKAEQERLRATSQSLGLKAVGEGSSVSLLNYQEGKCCCI